MPRPYNQVLGDPSEGDPPVPIPNTAVKPLSPDGTARASVWESRKLPGYIKSPSRKAGAFVVFWDNSPKLRATGDAHRFKIYPSPRLGAKRLYIESSLTTKFRPAILWAGISSVIEILSYRRPRPRSS